MKIFKNVFYSIAVLGLGLLFFSLNPASASASIDLEPTAVNWTENGLLLDITNNGSSTFVGDFIVSMFDLDSETYVDYYQFDGYIGASYTPSSTANVVINNLYGSQSHYPNLEIKVDYANTVSETNEDNNIITHNYYAGLSIDLEPTAVSWIGNNLELDITNNGSSTFVGDFKIAITMFDLSGLSTQYYQFDGYIGANYTPSSTVTLLINTLCSSSDYSSLKVEVDSSNSVWESNEDNNVINYNSGLPGIIGQEAIRWLKPVIINHQSYLQNREDIKE